MIFAKDNLNKEIGIYLLIPRRFSNSLLKISLLTIILSDSLSLSRQVKFLCFCRLEYFLINEYIYQFYFEDASVALSLKKSRLKVGGFSL